MINEGKFKLLNTTVNACDYEYVLHRIVLSQNKKKSLFICPIASQTLVLANNNTELKKVLNIFDLVVPCSEWVKKSINYLYGTHLKKRAYGPDLMLKVCHLSEEKHYNIFLYGNTPQTLKMLDKSLKKRFPKIEIVGSQPSKFAPLSDAEEKELAIQLKIRKTQILFLGLGSPLQEEFAYNLVKKYPKITKSMTIITVGAAFDFISHQKPQANSLLGDIGLEWLFRLISEPKRLWRRYLVLGVYYIILINIQKLKTIQSY